MNAGQHWGARVGDGDAPEMAKAEAIGFGIGDLGTVFSIKADWALNTFGFSSRRHAFVLAKTFTPVTYR